MNYYIQEIHMNKQPILCLLKRELLLCTLYTLNTLQSQESRVLEYLCSIIFICQSPRIFQAKGLKLEIVSFLYKLQNMLSFQLCN